MGGHHQLYGGPRSVFPPPYDGDLGNSSAGTGLGDSPSGILNMSLTMFFQISFLAVLIGGLILAHDSILKERELGTAAWLLSKPLSRKALVLSKLIAHVVGLLVIVILVQAVIAYVLISIGYGGLVSIVPFFSGVGILGDYGLFYMVLALALGAFTLSRSATLGLSIVMGIVGNVLIIVLQPL
jgi:ABC-2 type transport system permease protein